MTESLSPISWRRSGSMKAAGASLLLDRDGVINRRIVDGYVLNDSDIQLISWFWENATPFSQASVPIFILSNQACIGRGLISAERVVSIMSHILAHLDDRGVVVAGYLICPHEPGQCCACRKPLPGLLLEAERNFGVDLSRSVFIGDADTDLYAGLAAGCNTFLVSELDQRQYGNGFASARDMLLGKGVPYANAV